MDSLCFVPVAVAMISNFFLLSLDWIGITGDATLLFLAFFLMDTCIMDFSTPCATYSWTATYVGFWNRTLKILPVRLDWTLSTLRPAVIRMAEGEL